MLFRGAWAICSDGAKLCDRLFNRTRGFSGMEEGGAAIDCLLPRIVVKIRSMSGVKELYEECCSGHSETRPR